MPAPLSPLSLPSPPCFRALGAQTSLLSLNQARGRFEALGSEGSFWHQLAAPNPHLQTRCRPCSRADLVGCTQALAVLLAGLAAPSKCLDPRAEAAPGSLMAGGTRVPSAPVETHTGSLSPYETLELRRCPRPRPFVLCGPKGSVFWGNIERDQSLGKLCSVGGAVSRRRGADLPKSCTLLLSSSFWGEALLFYCPLSN